MKWAASTPMNAEIVLPPITGQGWARGLAGTANSRTADAPIGATMRGMCGPSPKNQPQIKPVSVMPAKAPTHAMRRSRRVAPARIGLNRRKPRMRPPCRGEPMDSGIRELASVLKKDRADQGVKQPGARLRDRCFVGQGARAAVRSAGPGNDVRSARGWHRRPSKVDRWYTFYQPNAENATLVYNMPVHEALCA